MDSNRYSRVHEIFTEAFSLEGPEQAAYLDEACAGDPELRTEVDSLLDFGRQGIEDPNPFSDERIEVSREKLEEVARKTLSPGSDRQAHQQSTWAPERIGPYRILERIGMGGMGVVYEAEQESPRRKVALKVLHPLFATETMLRRFRQESEMLGRLQHPSIAQVFEAGTFDLGRGAQPYFAMELVEGTDLRTYCEREGLGRDQRLELLARICDAVQHAHEKGIIHRDLKPDNILITPDGNPKVLDFGIARSTESSTVLETMVTATGELMGTLAYMAPEQLLGEHEVIGPEADVYALGVIAFELVTRRLPHDLSGLPLSSAIRTLCENDAPRLSRIERKLRGDVETIVGKALEKEPRRRYSSAAALAADIRRYLGGHPIAAKAPSGFYRARKFAVRNRVLVSASVVLFFAATISTFLAIQAARDRDAANLRAYRLSMIAVGAAVEERQFETARRRLADIPESLRGWEWRHFASRCEVVKPITIGECGGAIYSLATNADGSMLLATSQRRVAESDGKTVFGGDLRRWNLMTGEARDPISLPGWGKIFPRRSRGDFIVVSQTRQDQPSLSVFQPDGDLLQALGRNNFTFEILSNSHAMALSPDGLRFAFALPRKIVIMDIERESLDASVEIEGEGWAIAFGPDGNTLAASSHAQWSLFHVSPGRLEKIFTHHPGGGPIAFRPDGHRMPLGADDGSVRLWDLRVDPPTENVVSRGRGEPLWILHYSQDGSILACGDRSTQLTFLDGETGEPFDVLALPGVPAYEDRPTSVEFLPTSQKLVTGHEGGAVNLWQLAERESVALRGHKSFVYPVIFSRDGNVLLSGGWDGYVGEAGSLRFWDVATGECIAASGAPDWIVLAASIDGRGLRAAVSFENLAAGVVAVDKRKSEVAIVDLRTGNHELVFETELGIDGLSLSPDGHHLLMIDRHGSSVRDLRSGEQLRLRSRDPQGFRTMIGPPGELPGAPTES